MPTQSALLLCLFSTSAFFTSPRDLANLDDILKVADFIVPQKTPSKVLYWRLGDKLYATHNGKTTHLSGVNGEEAQKHQTGDQLLTGNVMGTTFIQIFDKDGSHVQVDLDGSYPIQAMTRRGDDLYLAGYYHRREAFVLRTDMNGKLLAEKRLKLEGPDTGVRGILMAPGDERLHIALGWSQEIWRLDWKLQNSDAQVLGLPADLLAPAHELFFDAQQIIKQGDPDALQQFCQEHAHKVTGSNIRGLSFIDGKIYLGVLIDRLEPPCKNKGYPKTRLSAAYFTLEPDSAAPANAGLFQDRWPVGVLDNQLLLRVFSRDGRRSHVLEPLP